MPLYVVGLMGMTRRLQHYDVVSWQPWLVVAAAGAVIIFAGVVCQIVQFAVSIRHREEFRDVTGDPWNGRTLEWSTASPPPAWNFAFLPHVTDRDAYWVQKTPARKARSADASAQVRADRNTEKHSDRLRQCLLCRGHRLCADLAHLVDGRSRGLRRIRDVPRIRISREGGGRDTG